MRYLGPARLGSYSFAAALVAIVGSLAQLTGALVVRDIVIDQEHDEETLGSAALVTALLVVASEAVLVVVGLTAVHDSTTRSVLFVLAIGLLFRPMLVIDYWFQAELRARQATLARNVGMLVAAAATIVVVVTKGSLILLATATILSPFVSALLSIGFYRTAGRRLSRWRPSRIVATSLARRAFPLIVSSAAIGVYLKIDQVMLGWMSTREEAGVYAAAVRISELLYFLPIVLTTAVGPSVARARATDYDLYQARLARLFSYLGLAAIAIISAMQVFGGQLAVLLYGKDFSRVGGVLAVHIFASLFVFLGVGESLWTVNESLERLAMYRTIVGAVVNVALNLLLIPHYGALGSAWATLVAYAVATTIGNFFHSRTRPVFWMQLRSLSPVSWFTAMRFDLKRST